MSSGVNCSSFSDGKSCNEVENCFYDDLTKTASCNCNAGYGKDSNGNCVKCQDGWVSDHTSSGNVCKKCDDDKASFYGSVCIGYDKCVGANLKLSDNKLSCACADGYERNYYGHCVQLNTQAPLNCNQYGEDECDKHAQCIFEGKKCKCNVGYGLQGKDCVKCTGTQYQYDSDKACQTCESGKLTAFYNADCIDKQLCSEMNGVDKDGQCVCQDGYQLDLHKAMCVKRSSSDDKNDGNSSNTDGNVNQGNSGSSNTVTLWVLGLVLVCVSLAIAVNVVVLMKQHKMRATRYTELVRVDNINSN